MLDAVRRQPAAGRESNHDYYLRRAREEVAFAERCSCPDTRERHRELAKLLLSIAGDHASASAPPPQDRTTVAGLTPGLVIISGAA